MAEEDMDGLLSQEDINAALEAAGLSDENAEASPGSADSSSNQQESGQMSQEDINAALEEAQADESQAAENEAAPPAEQQVDQQQTGDQEERLDSSGRPFDDVAAAMAEAIQQESGGQQSGADPQTNSTPPNASPLKVPELEAGAGHAGGNLQGIELLRDVE